MLSSKVFVTKADFQSSESMTRCQNAINDFLPFAQANDKLFRQKFEHLLIQLKRNLSHQEIIVALKGNGYIDDYKQSIPKLNEICRQIKQLSSSKNDYLIPNNQFKNQISKISPRVRNQHLELTQLDSNLNKLQSSYAQKLQQYVPNQKIVKQLYFRPQNNHSSTLLAKKKYLNYLNGVKLIVQTINLDVENLQQRFQDIILHLNNSRFYKDYLQMKKNVSKFLQKQDNMNMFAKSSLNDSLVQYILENDESIHASRLGWDDIE